MASAPTHRHEQTGGRGSSDRELGPDRLAAEGYLRSTHGFLVDTVDGRAVGVVDDVIIDAETRRVVRLEVCCGWFGRRRVFFDVDDVAEILPYERRLTVVEAASEAKRR